MIDIMAAFENEPPELDFILPGFLAGTVGALVAPGATGKSFWTLEAAMSIACSVAGGDILGLNPQKHGRVVYAAAEDPEPVLIHRVHAIGKHLNHEERKAIAQNLFIEPLIGSRMNLMDDRHRLNLIDYCKQVGARLIVIDTLSRFHMLAENDNGAMAALLSTLENIAAESGAGLLYLHHVSKSSALNGFADQQQAARGAGALVDNARWTGYLTKMTKSEAEKLSDRKYDRQPIGESRRAFFVRFGINKINYSEPEKDRWYQRGQGGVLLPVELYKADENGGKPTKRTKPQQQQGGGQDEEEIW